MSKKFQNTVSNVVEIKQREYKQKTINMRRHRWQDNVRVDFRGIRIRKINWMLFTKVKEWFREQQSINNKKILILGPLVLKY